MDENLLLTLLHNNARMDVTDLAKIMLLIPSAN